MCAAVRLLSDTNIGYNAEQVGLLIVLERCSFLLLTTASQRLHTTQAIQNAAERAIVA